VIVNNTANLLGTIPGMILIESTGRKNLLIYGSIGISISHFLLYTFINLVQTEKNFIYGVMSSIFLFFISFSATWGHINWVYCAEIFPTNVRAKGSSVGTMSHWAWNCVVSLSTPYLVEAISTRIYLIFGIIGLLMGLFSYYYIPETKGKTLEEIDLMFKAHED
jgi:Sugar (and other) transporter